ncbi:MAG TPA: helix-turn-helix domain-containing protein, partial [Ardenticatenaceae bacterium]|nr:helix-turn-helix domain-containing protein [Ardenticatenaceae bacterium]
MRNPPEPAAFDVVRAYTAFGPFLRYLRRRAQLTQSALSVGVGYSPAHISLLEGGQRQPDLTAVAALFLPALGLQEEPELAAQLLRLAAAARGETGTIALTRTVRRQVVVTEVVEAEEARTPRLPPATPRLPAPTVPLIGREQEREELSALLLDASVRLLTLAGPPGVGKSRLALHVAWELQSAFAGGASFLELAAVQEAALVATTVMQGLGITGGSGETGAETAALRAALRDQELLLVLDNFEQVLPAASLVADLLAAAPRLKILVTSREALRLYGEHLVAVPPLPLPDLAEIPPPDELAHVPSVALVVARARAVRPGFALTASNAPAVAAICVRLDGLPLAIELAAAQSRLFAPQELAARLIRQEPRGHAHPATLQVLARGARNLPRRQQTLEAAIEWSYRLLEPDEQALLARLGVFSGGFDLLAIEGCGLQADGSVLEEGPSTASRPEAAPNRSALHSRSAPKGFNPQPSTQERLRSLVDKSLVQVTAGEPTRFTLLEILREYALEQLAARGELDEARRRHAEYFTTLAEETLPHLFE